MNNPCTLYIVRHGETKWNVKGKMQGQRDISLTTNGKQQAKDLAMRFRQVRFDAIFSSDLARAYDTAYEVALQNKLDVVTSLLLREKKLGSLEGKYIQDMKKFDNIIQKLSEAQRIVYRVDNTAESDSDVITRCMHLIREIAVRYASKTVMLVTHGAVMRSMLIHVGYATYASLSENSIKNTAYVHFQTDGKEFLVKETYGITLRKG